MSSSRDAYSIGQRRLLGGSFETAFNRGSKMKKKMGFGDLREALRIATFIVFLSIFAPRLFGGTPLAGAVPDYTALESQGNSLGAASSGVSIEVFSDFQCHLCKSFFEGPF